MAARADSSATGILRKPKAADILDDLLSPLLQAKVERDENRDQQQG
jgi:hypothetical protein